MYFDGTYVLVLIGAAICMIASNNVNKEGMMDAFRDRSQ